MIYTSLYDTPCGRLLLGDWHGQLCLCDWYDKTRERIWQRVCNYLKAQMQPKQTPLLSECRQQLDRFFFDAVSTLTAPPMVLCGTPFQKSVWEALCAIPVGETCSYSQLAVNIGKPHSVRAVASAARANAISIFIPCHRLIGSDGDLRGYAGGLNAKQALLSIEHK